MEPVAWLSIERIHPRNVTRLADGEASSSENPCTTYPPRMARSQGQRGKIRSRGTLRSEREAAPSSPNTSSTWQTSPKSSRSMSSRLTDNNLQNSQNTTASSFARPLQSTTTPIASLAAPGRRHAGIRRPDLHDPMHQQSLPDEAPGTDPGRDPAHGPAGRCRRLVPGNGRIPSLVVKIPDGSFSRGVIKSNTPEEFAASPTNCSRRPIFPGAKIPADGIRLARRRTRGRAIIRLSVSDGARSLADRQAPPGRLVARGRLSHLWLGSAPPDLIDMRCGRLGRSGTGCTAWTSRKRTAASS